MELNFTGKAAFVTGGSKGIGKSIAETLVEGGANVGVTARGEDELDATVAELNAKGPGRALALPGDVSSFDDVGDAVRRTAQEFGGLDFAVNNAAIAAQAGLLHETGPEN